MGASKTLKAVTLPPVLAACPIDCCVQPPNGLRENPIQAERLKTAVARTWCPLSTRSYEEDWKVIKTQLLPRLVCAKIKISFTKKTKSHILCGDWNMVRHREDSDIQRDTRQGDLEGERRIIEALGSSEQPVVDGWRTVWAELRLGTH